MRRRPPFAVAADAGEDPERARERPGLALLGPGLAGARRPDPTTRRHSPPSEVGILLRAAGLAVATFFLLMGHILLSDSGKLFDQGDENKLADTSKRDDVVCC